MHNRVPPPITIAQQFKNNKKQEFLTQKKRTKKEIENVVGKYEKDSWDEYQAGKLQGAEEILRHMGLLEE